MDPAGALSAEGAAALACVDSLGGYREQDSLALAQSLRAQGFSAEVGSAALTQSRLRQRGAAKFGAAAPEMLFTQAGLEQATRSPLAALHAARFVEAGVRRVTDLGCGIGADSMAFAQAGLDVVAVERDEVTEACVRHNLQAFPGARTVCGEASGFLTMAGWRADRSFGGSSARAPFEGEGYWLDPARRNTGTSGTTRIFDPEAFSPPLSFAVQLADRGAAVGVKLGPGIPHDALPPGCEAQWTSVDGDLVEVALWYGPLAREGVRRAARVAVSSGASLKCVEITSPVDFVASEQDASLGPVSGYLYEPDAAVIRAGLVADLARQMGAQLMDPRIAYLRSDALLSSPFARTYRILEVLPLQVKTLRRWVREHGVSVLEIKKRGVAVTPEELRKQLLAGASRGSAGGSGGAGGGRGGKATLVLTRIGEERVAVVVEGA
nr:SAM-dependent methyltransferase [Psychromicrobium sp. YIM S02556]